MIRKFCSWSGLLSAYKLSYDPLVLGLEHSQKLVSGETGAPEDPDPTWHCFQVCISLLERERDTKLGLKHSFSVSATGSYLTLVTSLQMLPDFFSTGVKEVASILFTPKAKKRNWW